MPNEAPGSRTSDYADLPRDLDGFPYRISGNRPYRVSRCCGAYPTYHDGTLCCKACWFEVEPETDAPARLAKITPLRPERPGGPYRYQLPPHDE